MIPSKVQSIQQRNESPSFISSYISLLSHLPHYYLLVLALLVLVLALLELLLLDAEEICVLDFALHLNPIRLCVFDVAAADILFKKTWRDRYAVYNTSKQAGRQADNQAHLSVKRVEWAE